jgi:spore germination protein
MKDVILMKEQVREHISPRIAENLEYIKELLEDNSDIVFRKFKLGKWRAALIYVDGMADKKLLNDYVLEPLMKDGDELGGIEEMMDRILAVSEVKENEKLNEGIKAMLSGDTLMLLDGVEFCLVIGSRSWPARGVGEPSSETVIRGAREGFTETIRFNTALVRRRIRDTRLKVVSKSVGTRSKTDLAVIYIDDIVNRDVLEDLMNRIGDINIDAILDSGYVEQFIMDNKWSPFPQVQSTERPDVVAAAVYEGRVAVLVDNSPHAIIVPATLPNLFQSPDDYYQRWIHGSLIRLIRLTAILLSIVLPGLYVAVTSFHPTIIPLKLAYAIAGTREGIPFPAFIEALVMEVSLAFLIEAIVRLPKPIGSTIGIVGGLIIGQAAVSAGIVSPIMIIIVSLTAITSFITPNYEVTMAFRIMRVSIIIGASILGLYGIMAALVISLIHLIRLKSFGIPYLSPIVNVEGNDMKDMFIRSPLQWMKKRPNYMNTWDKIRQK